jgi:hypothetical protein
MNWQERLANVQRYQRQMAVALLVGITMLGIQSVWDPSVTALEPAELEGQPVVLSGLSPNTDEPTMDFVFRPLFSISRRAAERNAVPEPEIEIAVTEEVVVADMKGFVLLGVFASANSEGVILRSKDGVRQRLFVGEQVGGWTLSAVEPRAGEFSGPLGERGRLTLAVTSTLPPLAAPQRDERGAENVDAAAAELKVEQKPEELRLSPVTFDAIWEQRRRDAQAVQTMPSE